MRAALQRLQLVSTLLLMLAGALFMTGAITAMSIEGMPIETPTRALLVLVVLASMAVSVCLTLGITYVFFKQLVSDRLRRLETFLCDIVNGRQDAAGRIDVYGKDDIDQLTLACNALVDHMQHVSHNGLQLSEATRLLALNTMLDAARAGDEAKGLGMLAMQIHQLAEQQTTLQDADIRRLLSGLQMLSGR